MSSDANPGTVDRSALVDEILSAQARLARSMEAAVTAPWVHLELTMAQLKVLASLAHEGPRTVGQVGDALGIGTPAASYLIDRLVRLGLVSRDEDQDDRRRKHVELSAKGARLISRLRQGGVEVLRRYLELLTDADLAAVARGTSALADVAERRAAGLAPDAGASPPP